jgi:hypothetical protein
MEKNIFRIKELVAVVRIRRSFYDFWQELRLGEGQQGSEQVLLDALMKCEAVIEAQLAEEAAALETAKYNIYTLVSYLPIRQHLQKVKLCYEFALDEEHLDWEAGFHQLTLSRDPANHPLNKSLLIFNLNIWYLYLKMIANGKHRSRG